MNRTNKDIKDQYDFFMELLKDDKIISSTTIQLEPKKSNAKWLTGESSVNHINISEDISFLVERSKRDSKYGIKLSCKSFTKEPFFRFDSDGPAHRNDSPNTPLEYQVITTPHFNSYDERGKPIAFKNANLKIEEDAKRITEDINFGVSIFCVESNCKLSSNEFPNIIDKVPEIDFEIASTVNYDNIEFV